MGPLCNCGLTRVIRSVGSPVVFVNLSAAGWASLSVNPSEPMTPMTWTVRLNGRSAELSPGSNAMFGSPLTAARREPMGPTGTLNVRISLGARVPRPVEAGAP